MTYTNSTDLNLQVQNSFDTKKVEFTALFRPMAKRDPKGRFAETAIRLRAIRRASPYPTPKGFADFLGITVPRLSNFENGYPISMDVHLVLRMSQLHFFGHVMELHGPALTKHYHKFPY